MYSEHVVYSLAFAIVAILLLKPKEAGLCTLVIVVSGCIPDIDGIFDLIRHSPTFTDFIIPHMTEHTRIFHTIGALIIYAIIAGVVLYRLKGLAFLTGAFFAGVGFALHLFEDALVYNPAAAFFWPLSSQETGLGWLPNARNFLGIANTEVLLIGLILLATAAGMSLLLRRTEWTQLPWPGQAPGNLPIIDEIFHLPGGVPVPDDTLDYEPLQKL